MIDTSVRSEQLRFAMKSEDVLPSRNRDMSTIAGSFLLSSDSIRHGGNGVGDDWWWSALFVNFTCVLLIEQVWHEKDWAEAVRRWELEYS
jgi:hypothetical protein